MCLYSEPDYGIVDSDLAQPLHNCALVQLERVSLEELRIDFHRMLVVEMVAIPLVLDIRRTQKLDEVAKLHHEAFWFLFWAFQVLGLAMQMAKPS
jgi:hypothetical protein